MNRRNFLTMILSALCFWKPTPKKKMWDFEQVPGKTGNVYDYSRACGGDPLWVAEYPDGVRIASRWKADGLKYARAWTPEKENHFRLQFPHLIRFLEDVIADGRTRWVADGDTELFTFSRMITHAETGYIVESEINYINHTIL